MTHLSAQTVAIMQQEQLKALLAKLRESHLSTDNRRTALDSLRNALDSLLPQPLLYIINTAIQEGPNDVRRIAFQTLSSRLETDLFENATVESSQRAVNELIQHTEAFLRSTVKVQPNLESITVATCTPIDVSKLSISALRAIAAALKTLHVLIRVASRRAKIANSTSQVSRAPHLISFFDVIWPCLSVGVKPIRPIAGAIPRSSSGLQNGAFSWNGQPNRTRNFTSGSDATPSERTSSLGLRSGDSSAGETDRRSDKSESEKSDFSTASSATASSRSRKDGSRQHESTCKLIRQNSLYCLTELNQLESRALISRWSDLLPDQPAPVEASSKQLSALPRFSASSTSAAPFSLCTLITQDASTSVRVAAMAALESILTQGTLQLCMAQERAHRALSFTSLSSQLAGWIVSIRSYLVIALQRAATAPRASARMEGVAEVVGYPSSLTAALLQLTRTFVMSTAKAKLVTANAVVLTPAVVPFASHSDPQVQSIAKKLITTMTTPALNTSTREGRTRKGMDAISLRAQQAGSPPSVAASDGPRLDLSSLVDQGAVTTIEACDRVLSGFEAVDDPVRQLSVWTLFAKSLVEAPTRLLSPDTSARVFAAWHRLCARSDLTQDQKCALVSSVPDLHATLLRHSALDVSISTLILQYVERCCTVSDECVRAAAIRVLGLLVLPADHAVDHGSQHHEAIYKTLDDMLWGRGDATRKVALHDSSTLVRQRASWAFSNLVEAQYRSDEHLDEREWIAHARYCLDASKDIEGVAVSAYRASGMLLALLQAEQSAKPVCCLLGRSLLEELCRVLGATSKPPKSRWNAASALERALGSDVVLASLVDDGLLDQVVDRLCSVLDAKVFKVRLSAANALVSLCKVRAPDASAEVERVLGAQRLARIHRIAQARLAELNEPTRSKESMLYLDELKCLLAELVAWNRTATCS